MTATDTIPIPFMPHERSTTFSVVNAALRAGPATVCPPGPRPLLQCSPEVSSGLQVPLPGVPQWSAATDPWLSHGYLPAPVRAALRLQRQRLAHNTP